MCSNCPQTVHFEWHFLAKALHGIRLAASIRVLELVCGSHWRCYWRSSEYPISVSPWRYVLSRLTGTFLTSPTDRTDDEAAFKKLVEEDAVNFRPLGEKIHSYVRRSGQRAKDPREIPVGKAKELPGEDEEGVVVYEVYHVSILVPHTWDHSRSMYR